MVIRWIKSIFSRTKKPSIRKRKVNRCTNCREEIYNCDFCCRPLKHYIYCVKVRWGERLHFCSKECLWLWFVEHWEWFADSAEVEEE